MKKAVLVILFTLLLSNFLLKLHSQSGEVRCDERVKVTFVWVSNGLFGYPLIIEYRYLECSDGTTVPL
tara:strand:- start:241 stop:444 length:204 start_codon:yes stop_codon:yes gene_type:complete